MRLFQQIIAAVHLHTNGVQRLHHLGYIGNDGLFPVGQFSQKMMLDNRINAELNFLGVNQYKLSVQTDASCKAREVMMALSPTDLPLSGSTGNQHVRHFARSTMNTSLVMVLPNAMGKSYDDS